MVVGGGGIAGTPARGQEDEQKERTGHARLDGFLHPALSSSTVPLLILTCAATNDDTAHRQSVLVGQGRDALEYFGNAGLCVLRRLPHSDRLCTRRANCSGAELL